MLQSQFKSRTVERVYHAVVHGKPPCAIGDRGRQDSGDQGHESQARRTGRRSGREAITHWSLEETEKAHSLIRIKIDTGRRAQIRLHMANLGRPWQGTLGRVGEGQRQQALPPRLIPFIRSPKREEDDDRQRYPTGPQGRAQSVNAPLEYLRIDDKLNRRNPGWMIWRRSNSHSLTGKGGSPRTVDEILV